MKTKGTKPIAPKDLKQIGKDAVDKLYNIKCQNETVEHRFS